MEVNDNPTIETDARFPSGPWTGFFLQKQIPGKHQMDLRLNFSQGTMTGTGRDWVGEFIIRGRYDVQDGRCHWHKSYLGRHDVYYKGYNEGKGIWGTWEIAAKDNLGVPLHGGFHIWPEGMPDPTEQRLWEEADVPAEGELVGAGAK